MSAWVIEHPKGNVLFDSGLHIRERDEPPENSSFDVRMEHQIDAALIAKGVDPERVDVIIFSHLHWDHCGGSHLIPNARFMVQSREWEIATRDQGLPGGYERDLYDLGHDIVPLDGEHDVFGDGSVVCVPTPGHTAGHQSLRVNLEGGSVLLVADCCYWSDMLENDLLPPEGLGYDRDAQRRSMQRLRDLQSEGVVLYFGHDKEQWQGIKGKVFL